MSLIARATAAKTPRISQNMTLGSASVLMALMILLSRVTGFGRMMVTSHLYGQNAMTDAYNAAFNIPDTISIIIAGGALATGFVPVFTEYLSRGETERAQNTFRAMLTLLGASFGVISLALFALTFTSLGHALAQSQVKPQYVDLYFQLLRILLVAQWFFVLGGLFSGTLNALRLFWGAALLPVAFNLGIIVGGIVGPKMFGMGIESQAWGALAGAFVGAILVQVPVIWRNGLSLRPLWNPRDDGVQRVLVSLLPIVFGLASGQIIALNLTRFLVGAGNGDISAIDSANRLMQLPLAIFASGPAIALFPTISLLATEGKRDELRAQLASGLRRTILMCLWASALLMALSQPLVRLLLQHGQFSAQNTRFTALVTVCFAFGLVGLGAQQILARGFYAQGQTRTPVVLGAGCMALFGALGWIFRALGWGAPGLALAASVALTVLGAALWTTLRKQLGGWDEGQTQRVLLRGLVAAVPSGVTSYVVVQLATSSTRSGSLGALLALTFGAVVGTTVFIVISQMLKIEEISALTSKLKRRK